MKRANKPTEYILIKAYTNSEWDNCSFAIITIEAAWLQQLQQRLYRLQAFLNDNSFYANQYWETPEGYYTEPDGWSIGDILKPEEEWCFVTTGAEELENLPKPESRLDCHCVMVDKYGNAQYRAYGKHTGEEFYTDVFFITALLNQFGHDAGNG